MTQAPQTLDVVPNQGSLKKICSVEKLCAWGFGEWITSFMV